MRMKFLIVLFALFEVVSLKQLVLVQALWRHGDRSPEGTYPGDPVPESAWPVAYGQLSPTGMHQQYLQGLKFQTRYMNQFQFLNKTYTAKQIHVRSDDMDRTLASALSNMAGLFSESVISHPDVSGGWPAKYTPVPIHTIASEMDNLINVDWHCPKMQELEVKQATHGKFLKWMAEQAPTLLEVSEKSGIKITEIKDLRNLFDTLSIEKAHNMTIPSWVTDDLYAKVEDIVAQAWDYLAGQAQFGIEENRELIKLKNGMLLKTMIGNIEAAAGSAPYNAKKYFAYSGHDTTVSAFLRTLQIKDQVLHNIEPDFAATVVLELWADNNYKNFFVEVLYVANSTAPFVSITKFIPDCGNAGYCPLPVFELRSQFYMPTDLDKECL
uniref:Lysosomal acid phosphatase n=1 Tax=Rhabditophanes sp. KR3021 TaxID=114890 RepID=A0AC35TVV6_9BILA